VALTLTLSACKRDPGPPAATPEDHEAPAPSASAAEDLDGGADASEAEYELPDAAPGFFVPGAIGSAMPIPDAGAAPTVRYAALTQVACEAELKKRAIAFVRTPPVAGVRAPVRLKGPLHGIAVHTALPPAQREKSESEIFDCRLVLAVDDYATLLAKHDVVEVIHFSAFRSAKNGGCTPKYTGKQHCAGLALDIGSYVKRDGTKLEVLRDFGGRIGSGTCEPGAKPTKPSAAATELWGFVCEAARQGWFNVILTPNFNQQHQNHMHVEVTPDAGWMLVH
jgi:hypothetical protein